jgi:uncharacterized DUF497 family protein
VHINYQWDPAKAEANVKKHGVEFADAVGVLADPTAITIEDPQAEGEQRFLSWVWMSWVALSWWLIRIGVMRLG